MAHSRAIQGFAGDRLALHEWGLTLYSPPLPGPRPAKLPRKRTKLRS